MLSKDLQREIIKIDLLMTPIQFDKKNRFRLYILSNPNKMVFISLENITENKIIFNDIIETSETEYMDFINTLRYTFIKYGALVSKLNRSNSKYLTYDSQELYFSNVSMNIKINNKQEELEALKAHAEVHRPKDVKMQKKKSIQLN